jgi:hypothetical protein
MMKIIRLAVIANLIFVFMMGCSGNYGNQKTLSKSDSTVTQQELIDNWSDYNISFYNSSKFGLVVIVFDPKNGNRKIFAGRYWDTIKDQETWTEFKKSYATVDGDFKLIGSAFPPTTWGESSGVREIWGPDNQQYGLIIYHKRWDYFASWMVDENTLRVAFQPPSGGNPAK